jgi:hypothetical protein
VLSGRKSIESRFSRHRVAPFGQVGIGDLLLLKSQSGPISGIATVSHVDSYVLDPATWTSIRDRFSTALCAEDDEFWTERRDARFATLMRLAFVHPIAPLPVEKRDRRPWVVLVPRTETDVNRNQLPLLPDDPARKEAPPRLVIRYETTRDCDPAQLRLLV